MFSYHKKFNPIMTNNIIKILDPHEAIKIAAGEVIERPANIIKELLENSIDAQAKNIHIYLQASGKELIKIIDDGCGMSPDDALLCFAHHATSKISKVDDLSTIATYGFRGEALSTIAAVSKVELITKTKDQKIATSIIFENSKCIKQQQAAHQTGTTFIITNLFDNIPARKKFLKSDDTEWNQIVTIFQAFCLRYLDINFKLFHNDNLMYNCQATKNIAIRSGQLWNSNLHEQLIEIPQEITKNITIHGAISNPHYYRFNRGQIFIFVNNRWVKNSELMKAIIVGYQGVLPHQKYPAAFIFIEINPQLIDVNIHPKKEEVKFLNPGIAQQILSSKIEEALSKFVTQKITRSVIPEYDRVRSEALAKSDQGSIQNKITEETTRPNASLDQINSYLKNPNLFEDLFKEQPLTKNEPLITAQPIIKALNSFSAPFVKDFNSLPKNLFSKSEQSNISVTTPQIKIVPQEINASVFKEEQLYSIIGQYHKTYILLEQNNELILVDQHAAHERIIYQRLTMQGCAPSIQLMFPHIIKLSAEILVKINAHMHLLSEHGILIDQLSETEIIVIATPVGMQTGATEEIIKMLADLLENQETIENLQINEKIWCAKACKTACKGGDVLEMTQMQSLIKELMITPNRFCCPHGRPTMYNMTLKEIEKHFKRDYVGNKEKNISIL
jgi:DNA mismatch repair protein MutL